MPNDKPIPNAAPQRDIRSFFGQQPAVIAPAEAPAARKVVNPYAKTQQTVAAAPAPNEAAKPAARTVVNPYAKTQQTVAAAPAPNEAAKPAARTVVNPYAKPLPTAATAIAPSEGVRTVVNPYAKNPKPLIQPAANARVSGEAAAPAAGPVVNPYLKRGHAAVYDANDVLFNSEKFTKHVNARNELQLPPTGYERVSQEGPDPRTIGYTTNLNAPTRVFLKSAYFKAGSGQFATLDKYQELRDKPLRGKAGPPEDVLANKVVLLRDPTGTKLVSPQTLEKIDPTFAQGAFKDLKSHSGKEINGQTVNNKITNELLIVKGDTKRDTISALAPRVKYSKYKYYQILIAVDNEGSDRQFVDLRSFVKEKPVPTLSETSKSLLKKVTSSETWEKISTILNEQRGQAPVSIQPAALAAAANTGTDTAAQPPAKRLRLITPIASEASIESNSNTGAGSGLDERPRGPSQNSR